MFKIQAGRYGSNWQDEETYIPSEDMWDALSLSYWIKLAERLETHERYNYRIVDETGKVYWHQCMPFEPIYINIADLDHNWLDDIRAGYGIDENLWARFCKIYLNDYYGFDKEE